VQKGKNIVFQRNIFLKICSLFNKVESHWAALQQHSAETTCFASVLGNFSTVESLSALRVYWISLVQSNPCLRDMILSPRQVKQLTRTNLKWFYLRRQNPVAQTMISNKIILHTRSEFPLQRVAN